MIRLGLFEQLFWRVVAIMAAVMVILVVFSHLHQQRYMFDAWRTDLRQEAAWIARHWGPSGPPAQLASAWRATHESVRLTVIDRSGATVADSHPAAGPLPDRAGDPLVARAPVELADGTGTLVLSRAEPLKVPGWSPGLVISMLGLIALAAAAIYPVVRSLTGALDRLSDLARRVADGHFGATLAPPRQRELGELVGAFNEMSLRLRDGELRRERLIADVSHELRSPMGRLRALGETIARHPDEAVAHLGQLESEIALMDRLVGDMLETARLEQGPMALRLGPVALQAWAEDAFARLRHQAKAAGVACTATVVDTDREALIDPQRMVQALGNLADNAINACGAGPNPRIDLTLTVGAADWSVTVADNGPGVPEADLPFVFDRFFRVQRDRGRESGGVGLGLSIVRSIAEAHGGAVSLDRAAVGGAVARLTLPYSPPRTPSQIPDNSGKAA